MPISKNGIIRKCLIEVGLRPGIEGKLSFEYTSRMEGSIIGRRIRKAENMEGRKYGRDRNS